jgi:WD40 repeat protein
VFKTQSSLTKLGGYAFAMGLISQPLHAQNRIDSSDYYFDGLVWSNILQQADLSNSDLIKMMAWSKQSKAHAEDMMVSRLQSALSSRETERMEAEASTLYPNIKKDTDKIHRHFVNHFLALEKAWRSDNPSIEYQQIAAGYHTNIVDFDPINHNRILMTVRGHYNVDLYLLDTETTTNYHILSGRATGPMTGKFIPSEPSKILVTTQDGLVLVDITDPMYPATSLLTNQRFHKLFFVPGSTSAVAITPDKIAWVIHTDEFFRFEERDQFLDLGQTMTSTALPGKVLSVTSQDIEIWKPDDRSFRRTIALRDNDRDKAVMLQEDDPDIITVITSFGVVSNYSLSSAERLASAELGFSCGRLGQGATFSADGKHLTISCRNDQVKILDAKTLKQQASITTKGAKENILALGGASSYVITWDKLGRKLALIDTHNKRLSGYITRNCGAKLTMKVFSCFSPNPVEPIEVHDAVINHWDDRRILTTNALSLTIWDTELRSPRSIPVFESHLKGATSIIMNPYNPNIVYLLKFGGWLAVLDFWRDAKDLLKTKP